MSAEIREVFRLRTLVGSSRKSPLASRVLGKGTYLVGCLEVELRTVGLLLTFRNLASHT